MKTKKKKFAYDLAISEESIIFGGDIVPSMIKHCLRDLRSKNWFVYKIEELDPHKQPHYEIMYGITKFRFHLQKLKSPIVNTNWCKARMIEND